MRRTIIALLLLLGLLWAGVLAAALAIIDQLDRWVEHEVELTGFEIWMASVSLWLVGELHENQIPGLVWMSILFCLAAAQLFWLWIAESKKKPAS